MQQKPEIRILNKCSWKRVFYTLCFIMFCIIDQRSKTGSGLDGWSETFRDMTGVVMACIILSHTKLNDFKRWKVPYLIWTAIGLIGGCGIFLIGLDNHIFVNDWFMVVLNVFLYGYVMLNTFISVVLEKNRPKHNKVFLMLWFVMMLLMVVSRSKDIWPFCYMIMFGCFYLTDFTVEEQEDLFHGALDGIIGAFFLFQGFCLVFRPYDLIRYTGIYSNPNVNAFFYLEVLAAVFVKILYATKKSACKWLRIFYWLGAGVLLTFLFMTIGRWAWVNGFILVLLFLIIWDKINGARRFFWNGILLVLCMCLTFPLCYGLVRYVPPVFHHPVWFWGEWSEERVHSWDAWNSEKYIEVEELMDAALGRMTVLLDSVLEHSPFMMKVDAAEMTLEEDPRIAAAWLTDEHQGDPILVRGTIYKYYIQHLNLTGHPYEEQGFQLFREQWIGHAHNIYLQYGTDFGVPVMILFMVLVVWSICLCWNRGVRGGTPTLPLAGILAFFLILVPTLYGLLEYSWGVGSLSITMLFISWRQTMQIT